ncbi:MAG: HAMP domain-containing sensor histidine kinase, partial [Bacillota bacterium]|nr:HAMP domain-containing sensor histidine kinase [Bacillota bacterium]
MILSGVVVAVFSRRFTQPILQMNAVTQDLAAQDFTKKVALSTKDELGDLGLSINKMSEQLETSIRDLKRANQQLGEDIELKNRIDTMRKEFIANASHELKTPISLILGYSEALKLPGLDQLTVEEYLDIIIDESNKMNRLVMSLLKISQLESGFQQFCVEAIPVKGLVDETMKLFSIKFAEKNVNVEVDADDVDAQSDYDAIQTVLGNYLSNAINHVEGENRIKVTVKPDDAGRIRVEVYNTGKPIPEDSLSRIWESFYKVDKARTRAYGGQGLGLSIVRILLESLHAGYGVENKSDGVLFWFDLPPVPS